MHGVGQAHRLAPAVGMDRDEAVTFQRFERRESEAGFKLAEPDRLAERQRLERGPSRVIQRADASPDQLVHPSRGADPPVELPQAVLADESPTGQRAKHQLAQRERVPVAGIPELRGRTRFERSFQDDVQQRIHAEWVELAQLEAHRPFVAPPARHGLRRALAGDDGGDSKHRAEREQVVDDGQRGCVEAMSIVDHQDRHACRGGVLSEQPKCGV